MLARVLFSVVFLATPALAASPRDEGFKKLTGAEIRKAFVGKEFTDDIHFGYRYLSGGAIEGMSMGKKVKNKWAIADDRLCVTDRFGENCYSVWKKGSAVKLTVEGSGFSRDGALK